jgi:hypothetical protein
MHCSLTHSIDWLAGWLAGWLTIQALNQQHIHIN